MTAPRSRRDVLALLAGAVAASACSRSTTRAVIEDGISSGAQTGSTVPPTPTQGPTTTVRIDPSAALFDDASVHDITLEVPADDVPRLQPGADERLRCRLSFDGRTLGDTGLRLKSGFLGSVRGIDQKAGFNVRTDAFVDGQNLAGLYRFTLGNAIQDPSFIGESLTYDLFRSAGIPAPRTALARVRLNGEYLGLYVLRETIDEVFLGRHFSRRDGNLYEGARRADVTDADLLALETNDKENDRSDLLALAAVVATASDAEYVAAVGRHVDLDQFFTYWAAESLAFHWDGYAVSSGFEGSPNNYYVYNDPARQRLVFLPHGADQTMSTRAGRDGVEVDVPLVSPPDPVARFANRLYRAPGSTDRLRAALRAVVARAWNETALLARADRIAAQVRADRLVGTREEVTPAAFEAEFARRRAFVAGRAAQARAALG
jgi:spore coat protein CotH